MALPMPSIATLISAICRSCSLITAWSDAPSGLIEVVGDEVEDDRGREKYVLVAVPFGAGLLRFGKADELDGMEEN